MQDAEVKVIANTRIILLQLLSQLAGWEGPFTDQPEKYNDFFSNVFHFIFGCQARHQGRQ